MISKVNMGPSFAGVELYKTVNVPLNINGPGNLDSKLQKMKAEFAQSGSVAGECRNIEESLKGKKNLFVFSQEHSSESGIFDIYVANGREGKLLQSIKNSVTEIGQIPPTSPEEAAKTIIFKSKLNVTLAEVQRFLVARIKSVI